MSQLEDVFERRLKMIIAEVKALGPQPSTAVNVDMDELFSPLLSRMDNVEVRAHRLSEMCVTIGQSVLRCIAKDCPDTENHIYLAKIYEIIERNCKAMEGDYLMSTIMGMN
jgi:hypothetical protein